MIARIWHGWTTPGNAPAYERLLRAEVLPSIAAKQMPGYHGAHVFRREDGDEVAFLTILWFDSLEAVRALSGDDYEVAYVPPQAQAVLSRFDARAQHYDVLETPRT